MKKERSGVVMVVMPACGRSVSDRQPHDDQNRVVLLVAAVHGRHGRPRIHRKTLGGSVRRRARVGRLRPRVAWGATSAIVDSLVVPPPPQFPPLTPPFPLRSTF